MQEVEGLQEIGDFPRTLQVRKFIFFAFFLYREKYMIIYLKSQFYQQTFLLASSKSNLVALLSTLHCLLLVVHT